MADPDLLIKEGPGHPVPELREGGWSQSKLFRPFGSQFGLKKGGSPPFPPGPSPGSALRSARERENKLRLHYVISMISGTL